MPGIIIGISLRLPSFRFPSSPYSCPQWADSPRLARKPDGFEAPPVFIPYRDQMAYKFIVDDRWMTNDAKPAGVDHGNVYTSVTQARAFHCVAFSIPNRTWSTSLSQTS
jgi:hypothetical protein